MANPGLSPYHLERRQRMSAAFRRGVPVREIAADFGVQPPAIWKSLRQTGDLPPYKTRQAPIQRQPRALVAPPKLVRVDRDPCPWCGTRRDYGCKHAGRW